MPKHWGPRSRWPAPSPQPASLLTAQLADLACRPPGGYPNLGSALEWPLPRGLAPQHQGMETSEPQPRTHPRTPLSQGLLKALPVIQGGRTGTALRHPGAFEGTPHQNDGAHAPASQCPHLIPPLDLTHSLRIGPAGLSLVTLTLDRPPRGPSRGAWSRIARNGPQSQSTGLTLSSHSHPDCYCATGNSGRENGHCPPRSRRHSKAPCSKTLGPTLPLASALTSAQPSAHLTDGRSGLPASWELALTLGPPGGAPPKGPGAAMPGLETPEPQRHTQPAAPPPPWLLRAPPVIQGGRMCRAF